jgi:squalene synthase HpnC
MDPGAARAADENFPVALRLLPTSRRKYLMAVYGFARTTDDIGDRAPPDQRASLLDELEADLRRLYASLGRGDGGGVVGDGTGRGDGGGVVGDGTGRGDGGGVAGDGTGRGDGGGVAGGGTGRGGGGDAGPASRVVASLGPAVADCGIPIQPFLDLIQANRQDQEVSRYQGFGDLHGYCRLSADPVGRIVLYVFGVFSQERAGLSDSICTALQLAEHWQDVAEDLRAGRIYLPAEDMATFGCTEEDLAQPSASPQVRELLAFETRRAREMLDRGAPLISTLHGAARVAVAGYVAGGRAALAAIAAADHDVLRATPRPRKQRLAAELILAYARGR